MKGKKIGKKGASHIEIILSFVIFISFVSFLLIVFNPLKIFSSPSAFLDITESEILKNISTGMKVISLKINPEVYQKIEDEGKDCFSIDKIEGIKDKEDNLIVRKGDASESEVVNAGFSGNKISIQKEGMFYRLYFSQEFLDSKDTRDCTKLELAEKDYALGIMRNYRLVSSSSLAELFNSYDRDYAQLKQEINLENEFYIEVRSISQNEVLFKPEKEKFKPKGIEITARDVPIEILNQNGEIATAILSIQVWD